MTYSEKLRDPRWQKKRLEVLQRDDFTCQMCLDNTQPLHVHHRVYELKKEPWEYPVENLITLCECCHSYETTAMWDVIKDLIRLMKGHFLTDNIRVINQALEVYEHLEEEEICAHAIAYFLSDYRRCKYMIDEYLKHGGHYIDADELMERYKTGLNSIHPGS